MVRFRVRCKRSTYYKTFPHARNSIGGRAMLECIHGYKTSSLKGTKHYPYIQFPSNDICRDSLH